MRLLLLKLLCHNLGELLKTDSKSLFPNAACAELFGCLLHYGVDLSALLQKVSFSKLAFSMKNLSQVLFCNITRVVNIKVMEGEL